MKQFDLEKYESIFFNLLEGNYSKQEEETILEEIEANAFLKFEWDNWQKAVLEDDSETYAAENAAFFEALKDDVDAVKVVPIWSRKRIAVLLPYVGLAAACLLIVFMFTINKQQEIQGEVDLVETDSQGAESPEIPQMDDDSAIEEVVAEAEELIIEETEVLPGQPQNDIQRVNNRPKGFKQVANVSEEKTPVEDVVIDLEVDESEFEDYTSPEIIIAQVDPVAPPMDEETVEPVVSYQRTFTVTTETVKKRDRVITQKELAKMDVRQLLQDKRIKLVNIGNKTYVQLESPNQETVLVGLSN